MRQILEGTKREMKRKKERNHCDYLFLHHIPSFTLDAKIATRFTGKFPVGRNEGSTGFTGG